MNYTTHRGFVLHDGEDEAKTNELHEFLDQPVHTRGHDWEGHNSGIYITLDVGQGDAIVVIGDGAFLILRKGEKVKITWSTFPMTHLAMLEVEMDNGAHHVNRVLAAAGEPPMVDLEVFTMPYEYGVDKLVATENALYNFLRRWGRDVFNEFCTGDQSMQEETIKSNPEMQVAHDLINAWFNGWSDE